MKSDKETWQPYRRYVLSAPPPTHGPATAMLDLRSLRRHAVAICSIVLLFFLLAIVFVMLRTPWYSASTRLIIDHRIPSLTVSSTVFMTSDLSGRLVDSQVEILRSQKVMVRALELLVPYSSDDLLPPVKVVPVVLDFLGIKKTSALTDDQKQLLALTELKKLLSITRVRETFTIEIRARSRDSNLVVRLATAMADAFLEDQTNANANAARGASPWLRERLKNSGTTARVISQATAPVTPDGPRARYIIIAFVLAGLVTGIGSAFTYDLLDTKIRTPEQASSVAQVECLGILPQIHKEAFSGVGNEGATANRWKVNYPLPVNLHALNCCSAAATMERPNLRTIGVTSCMPGEGKSTVAVNLARSVAASGLKVLLVDAATNNRDLSIQIAPRKRNGLHSVLTGKTDIARAVVKEQSTGVHFLPNENKVENGNALAIWGRQCPEFAKLLSKYDILVFDLPSVSEDCAARVAAKSLDGMLLVIEYGTLPTDTALKILRQAGEARNNFVGVILNKVDEANLKTYAS